MSDYRGFNFYVRGIEAGMLAVLTGDVGGQQGYAKTIISYRGELDDLEIKKESRNTLSKIVPKLPMFLIAYADGQNRDAEGSPWMGENERTFRHDCTFTVICCGQDWGGEYGVARMIDDAVRLLAGKVFVVTVGEGAEAEQVQLNFEPLTPSPQPPNPEYVVRMEELTAYAVHFDTFFHFETAYGPAEPVEIETIHFDVSLLNNPPGDGGLPGVTFK